MKGKGRYGYIEKERGEGPRSFPHVLQPKRRRKCIRAVWGGGGRRKGSLSASSSSVERKRRRWQVISFIIEDLEKAPRGAIPGKGRVISFWQTRKKKGGKGTILVLPGRKRGGY